jgi:hypothetical protein
MGLTLFTSPKNGTVNSFILPWMLIMYIFLQRSELSDLKQHTAPQAF